eukprot:666439-Amphidinium_carterae.1
MTKPKARFFLSCSLLKIANSAFFADADFSSSFVSCASVGSTPGCSSFLDSSSSDPPKNILPKLATYPSSDASAGAAGLEQASETNLQPMLFSYHARPSMQQSGRVLPLHP